jgi:hypothetical protein
LNVASYDRFLDHSSRSNYLASYSLQKVQPPAGTIPIATIPGGLVPGELIPGATIPGTILGSTPTPINLTGIWNCDDGGRYYVRQLGTALWWFGEQDPNYPSWSNVMRGTVRGNMINAEWSDVPKGSIMQYGNLILQIASNNRLGALSKTGGFGGSVWTR